MNGQERKARSRRLRRLRDVFVGPWMAETERNALEVENTEYRAALAAREDSERSDGQSTPLVEVKAEENGLVRVRLSLDAPSYLLAVSGARDLGETLIDACDELTHPEQEPKR